MFRGDGQFGGGPSPDEERQRVRDTVKGTVVSFVALCALIRLSKFGWETFEKVFTSKDWSFEPLFFARFNTFN